MRSRSTRASRGASDGRSFTQGQEGSKEAGDSSHRLRTHGEIPCEGVHHAGELQEMNAPKGPTKDAASFFSYCVLGAVAVVFALLLVAMAKPFFTGDYPVARPATGWRR